MSLDTHSPSYASLLAACQQQGQKIPREKSSPLRALWDSFPHLEPGLHTLNVNGHMAGGISLSFEAQLFPALQLSSCVTLAMSPHISEPPVPSSRTWN